MKTIIVDLDNTLCNTEHRDHLAQAGKWDAFHALQGEDEPNFDVLEMLDAVEAQYNIVILTARPERYRLQTMAWLKNYLVKLQVLIMRDDSDDSDSAIMKLKAVEKWFGGMDKAVEGIAFCLEDRDKVVKAFRKAGIPCWQVRTGSY